ncbi:hypothetical protein EMPS_01167 [Entomortierella parvispora]|uniref:Uncharacterized protein n=1 Tax=Entomortierella parvispora TaxID=205924 RepID=A0A9P3H2B2_9FUNG|nr:hypothetical protein EMPS_01167 [Entomortierella parvispora]
MNRDHSPQGDVPRHSPEPVLPSTPTRRSNSQRQTTASGTPTKTPTPATPSKQRILTPRSNSNNSGSTPHRNEYTSPSIAPGTKQDSTTPAYPESTVLMKRSFSNAKIDLSDFRPVDTQVLEKIKNLEISLEQHQNSIKELKTTIRATKNERMLMTAAHDKEMIALNEMLSDLNRSVTELEEQENRQMDKRQELLDSIQILREELDTKDNEIARIQQEFEQSRENRETLFRERYESEKDELEKTLESKEKLLEELDEIMKLQQEFDEAAAGVMSTCGVHEAEALKARVRELDDTILDLERAVIDSRNSTQVEEKTADDLVLMFEKIYERRIRSYSEEIEQTLQKAEETERERDQLANDTLREYLDINQLSSEAEDRATKEEFDLMMGRGELAELEARLQSLRIQLDQRLRIP